MSLKTFALAAALAVGFSASAHSADVKTVRLGVVAGPDQQVWEFLVPKAEAKGLKLDIVEFSDYQPVNEALNAGELDANAFQHQPYLDSQIAANGYKLVTVGFTYVAPIGFFSSKYKAWADLPQGATIAIPNDPTNGGRALLLLQSNGDIKLKDGVGLLPSVADITENKKEFKFLEVDAATTASALADVDAAAVNNNYAAVNKLDLAKDAILRESKDSPYANIIVVQEKDKDAAWAKALVELYQTPETAAFIEKNYGGSTFPAW
ncbi:MAG: MetQ/NlpA family ABC transporter substrate-binding protein [Methylobacteriaceae bacterium]|jgi:D-methionine transport system substrate-binding protein|nr:MetQ/NlpA family ABC transporter substrate-binding protein [Methylobacteriaceae bacterium]